METALLTLVIALSLVSMPGPPNASLDGSWQEMLVHAHSQGLQFGRDVIFTWGPWGFLCTHYHLGSLEAVPIIAWETGGQLLIAMALVGLTSRLALWRRVLFAAAVLAFHWLFQDVIYFVLISLVVLAGLLNREAPPWRLAAWTLALGFLAQLKFTYLVVSAVGVGTASVCWALQHSPKRAVASLGGYAVAIVGSWCAAGQNLDNLYPYIRRSLELSAGYGDAMGLDEPWTQFAWGAGIATVGALFAWRLWKTASDHCFGRGAAVFLAFSLFVMWKESFTRADIVPLGGHMFGLISYVVILSTVVGGILFPGKLWHWFDGTSLLCLLGLAFIDPHFYHRVARVEWERIYGNVAALRNITALPENWQRDYLKARAENSLPGIQAAVGRGTVDVYDYPDGTALLNELALSTRPIFQSYSAYTPGLEGWNLRFFQSGRAPDYLLWSDGRVDGRYPGEDDAMLVAALPGHYYPVLSEEGFLLLKRRVPMGPAPLARTLVLERTLRLGELLPLPMPQDHAMWLRADAVPDALGRGRAILYKPAQLNLVTADIQGQESSWRVLPKVASDGFLLVPTLDHEDDLEALMRGVSSSRVRSIRFEAPGDQGEFWSHVDVHLFSIPSLPLDRPSDFWLQELGIVDREPALITSVEKIGVIDIAEGKALFLHAPGRIAFDVPKGTTRFSGYVGLRPGAYTGDGHTAGVNFVVERTVGTGPAATLWSRYLNPLERAEDQGTQHFEIEMDAGAPSRVTLSTRTGPDNVNSWDWSYVTGLKFESDPIP